LLVFDLACTPGLFFLGLDKKDVRDCPFVFAI
jgi:hypothetical protein